MVINIFGFKFNDVVIKEIVYKNRFGAYYFIIETARLQLTL